MTKHKLRRKSFLSTMGMAAMGWLGMKSTSAAKVVEPIGLSNAKKAKTRVRPDPRAVPCSDRKL